MRTALISSMLAVVVALSVVVGPSAFGGAKQGADLSAQVAALRVRLAHVELGLSTLARR